ncbi:hypothetical protein PybrP1_012635 [[Pythium] brassicae (nom. inval.)]|nr:hypothetical protein PybrP1_012635 [[Pythium] brassicae (nom. inval.)]
MKVPATLQHEQPREPGAPDADIDEDALENAVWHEKHGAVPAQGKDFQTSTIDALLCCVRSGCIRATCVAFPCVLFLLVRWSTSSSKAALREVFLILAAIPPGIYVLCGLVLLCLVCARQIRTDTENAQQAHQYLASRARMNKIVVTSGDATSNVIPGRFAMFIAAAKDGNTFNFEWCLDNQQEPDQADHLGRTALHWAALSGQDEIVTLLLRNGASIDLPDKLEGLTPLHYAAYYGHVKVTRLLVNAGASLIAQDNRKMNPLQVAEMASLKLLSVQPSHQMIIKFLRIAMKSDVTPPLEHITGLTAMNLVERQIKALPQAR